MEANKCKQYITTEEIIERFKKERGDIYDYSKIKHISMHTKVEFVCKKHGSFFMSPHNFLLGQNCPLCAKENRQNRERENGLKRLVEEGNKRFNNKFDYSETIYINSHTNCTIKCPTHGYFQITPYSHLNTQFGCKQCAVDYVADKKIERHQKLFIKRVKKIHKGKYGYLNIYQGLQTEMKIVCPIHGVFNQTAHEHLCGCGCPKCAVRQSKGEDEIINFVNTLGIEVEHGNRKLIKPLELDIYVPSKHLAIEYNGLRWHSEQFKENADTYHLEKTNLCNEKGIKLIHIFEDEWHYKSDIIKSMLANMLGKSERRIFARKCEIREVKQQEASNFLKDNNIQDCCYEVKHNIGLYYQNELVSLITFCEEQNRTVVLNDYCTKLNTVVIGGASKLLKYFIRKEHPHKLYTLVDKRWSNGNLWKKLGFTKTADNKPNYYYVVDDHRESKLYYNKMSLVEQGFGKDKTEHQIMLDRGIYRIYDCGTMSFEMNIV